MSGYRLELKGQPGSRIDMSGVVPSALAKLSRGELERWNSGGSSACSMSLGDVFSISGSPGETLVIAGSDRLDFVGAGLDGGTIVVEGNVGAYAGQGMKKGRLDIKGNAGGFVASGLSGGIITISGSAGDNLGGARPGEKFGMAGGIVHVGGDLGQRAGDRMRRGTIVVKGTVGPAAGSRMMGGTIWTERGFSDGPGPQLRRGTLIGPSASRLLPTFSDCGRHQLTILAILSRALAAELGPLAPKAIAGPVRRLAGDMATIGKGEILLTA